MITQNELNKKITLTHTPTSYWLLQQDPDAFILYHFYCYTASWQQRDPVKATNDFVCKALRWGKPRLLKAKAILVNANIIEEKRPHKKNGDFGGSYLLVRTVKSPKTQQSKSEKQQATLVSFSTSAVQTTNTCKDNINTSKEKFLSKDKKVISNHQDFVEEIPKTVLPPQTQPETQVLTPTKRSRMAKTKGNPYVNEVIARFKALYGYNPTDINSRKWAYLLIKKMTDKVKSSDIAPSEAIAIGLDLIFYVLERDNKLKKITKLAEIYYAWEYIGKRYGELTDENPYR